MRANLNLSTVEIIYMTIKQFFEGFGTFTVSSFKLKYRNILIYMDIGKNKYSSFQGYD